jgi:hypothetical protein
MLKSLNNLWKRRSTHSLLEELRIIPQEALRAATVKIWKLRGVVAALILLCALLGAASIQGQKAFGKLSTLENETREKDTTIQELKKKTRELEEKLVFKNKVDALVARVQREDPSLSEDRIRPAAENALRHTTDPALYLAIGMVEAELKPHVVHPDGVALGMHGLCPKDWHPFLERKGIMKSRQDYFDMVKSFKGSEAIMRALLREWGSLEVALRFYNGGKPAALGKIPQSIAYAKRVLHLRNVLAA